MTKKFIFYTLGHVRKLTDSALRISGAHSKWDINITLLHPCKAQGPLGKTVRTGWWEECYELSSGHCIATLKTQQQHQWPAGDLHEIKLSRNEGGAPETPPPAGKPLAAGGS